MKILYIARHGQADTNDDEGAIAFALRGLGHQVIEVQERFGRAAASEADFCLFHKWPDLEGIARVAKRMPAVFWYFDLVDYPEPSIRHRCEARKLWMDQVIPLVKLGFCTDGDWVRRADEQIGQHNSDWRGKLYQLSQGADERVVGSSSSHSSCDVLFTGSIHGCGTPRRTFVNDLDEQFKGRLRVIESGFHGRALADLIASAKVVVAPDFPVTHHYWSNRVYLMAGFGACLVHPYCRDLEQHYKSGKDIVTYLNRDQLMRTIEELLHDPARREQLSRAALARTVEANLYRHRCQELIKVMETVL